MASNQDLVSMAQQFTGLPMSSLISGPLNAAADANAAMALTQTKFILDTCFQQEGEGDATTYKPIMIKLKISRQYLKEQPAGADGTIPAPTMEKVDAEFDLPLLTVIPINSLGVDNVDITFEMEVKSSFSEETSQESEQSRSGEGSFEAKVGWGPFSATIKGSASYDSKDSSSHSTHYEKSNSAKYTVNVHAGQLPLPKGVTTILKAYTDAIQPQTVDSAA